MDRERVQADPIETRSKVVARGVSVEGWLAERIRWQLSDITYDAEHARGGRVQINALPREDLEALYARWDLRFVAAASSRRRTGFAVVAFRRVLHKALYPLLVRASEFNSAVVRSLGSFAESLERVEGRLERAERESGPPAAIPIVPVILTSTKPAELQRQRGHVALFQASEGCVLDLGCGGGRFLELLRDAGIEGEGVDRDGALVESCRERGLKVHHSDAVDYLSTLMPASVGGIFLGHVVEHLAPAFVVRLLELARETLSPGAPIVLETMNPRSVLTHLSFWADLTRIRPYDPQTIAWLLGHVGFVGVEVEAISLTEPGDGTSAPEAHPSPDPRLERLIEALAVQEHYVVRATNGQR